MVTINKLFPFFSTCMSTWIRDSFCFTQVMATRRGQLCRLYPATNHIAIPGNDVVGHIITTAWVLSDSCGHFCLEFNHQTIKISFKIFRNGHRFPDVCNAVVVVESSRVPLRILAHFNGIPANSPTHRGAIGFMQKGILWTSRLWNLFFFNDWTQIQTDWNYLKHFETERMCFFCFSICLSWEGFFMFFKYVLFGLLVSKCDST